MPTRRHHNFPTLLLTRRQAGATILGLLGAHLTACGPIRPPRVKPGRKGAARLGITSPRIDAVPGRLLVIPVQVAGTVPDSTIPRLTLAGGREIEASLVWIGIETDAAAWSGWLPQVTQWVVTPVSDGAIPASVGAWHVVAHPPADAAGQSLRLGEQTVPVNWLAAPEDLRPGTVSEEQTWAPWRTPEDAVEPDASLLAPEWRNPMLQWRARLVTGSLGLSRWSGSPNRVPRSVWQVKGDPAVLDGLAELIESRWRVGLARLWYADPDACDRLLARLARTVECAPGPGTKFSQPINAPAWPTSQPVLDSLLTDLLDPVFTGDSLAARSNAWLDALPQAAAWVADDAAGLLGTNSEPAVQLRAACLDDKPILLWVSGRDGLRVGEPQTLEPGHISEVSAPVGQGSPMTGARGFIVRCGNHKVTLAAREVRAVRPPGASCGPLLHDWTLESWAASQPRAGATPDAEWAAGVLVYRDDSGASTSGWSAFVECASPEHDKQTEPRLDEVGVWFGQRGTPAAVLHISRDGTLRNERKPKDTTPLEVADQGSRWSVSVPIPREALEPGGILRLGLTRRDPRGVRTAWPRRLMPWDNEPARAAINLKTWSGLE